MFIFSEKTQKFPVLIFGDQTSDSESHIELTKVTKSRQLVDNEISLLCWDWLQGNRPLLWPGVATTPGQTVS